MIFPRILVVSVLNLLRALTSSLARRILQCLCHPIFLPSLRIRPLVELLVQ